MAHIHKEVDFTTSAFILHPTEAKFLLLFHNKLQRWLQPGGHIELDENPLQALEREIQEETGLLPSEYSILEPADHPRPNGSNISLPLPFYINEHPFAPLPGHRHIDICYVVRAHTDRLTNQPDGASDIAWLSLSEIIKLQAQNKVFLDTLEICTWLQNAKVSHIAVK